jgi:excinuclease UvrABC nuclease subunit
MSIQKKFNSKLEKFTFNNDRPLIYFLLHKGEVVYVGKTINFLSRIASHQRNEPKYKEWVNGELVSRGYDDRLKDFDEIYIKEVESEKKLVECERKCIKKFLPKYNTCAYAQRQHKKEIKVEPPIEDKGK